MSKDYVVGIGGTGARCLEALIYLAAAGLFERPLHLLMIDPDQNNGNSIRTKKLLPSYHKLNVCKQPTNAMQRGRFSGKKDLDPQVIFREPVNQDNEASFWQDPNLPNRKFSDVIDYHGLPDDFRAFVDLFYESTDLSMELGKGYRGRPNIGAVTLISDLRRTVKTKGNGLCELIESIEQDAKVGGDDQLKIVRVFVFGSVFGGTGAAGLPTIVELIRENCSNKSNLRFGCAMMTPYFTFPDAAFESREGPAPNSRLHPVATQAALLHYSTVPPGYQHVYTVGAPALAESGAGHKAGGDEQENESHYAEIIAALGARDFFAMDDINQEDRQLHYADGDHFGYSTLPAIPRAEEEDQRRIKNRLINFTTFAYLYRNILHGDCKDVRWLRRQAWYIDNFQKRGRTLEDQGETLDSLNEFLGYYLSWLEMIGKPIKDEKNGLLSWGSLLLSGSEAARELGNLTAPEQGDRPEYVFNSYGRIMERISALKPDYSNNPHPVGLMMYLVYEAVREFCRENYRLGSQAAKSVTS